MNHSTLWRSAFQLGAAFIFTVGRRFERRAQDTAKTHLRVPLFEYADFGAFAASSPHSAPWVAVEMGGTPLESFEHPDRAVYLLGSEDNGLPDAVLRSCAHHVALPCAEGRSASFNVAVAGAVLMADRLEKRRRRQR